MIKFKAIANAVIIYISLVFLASVVFYIAEIENDEAVSQISKLFIAIFTGSKILKYAKYVYHNTIKAESDKERTET